MKNFFTLFIAYFVVQLGAVFGQNDKIVLGNSILTPSQIANGAYITYLIRFQNFEGDTASSVSIRDTLDPKLDATSLEMVDASHDYQMVRGGEVVRWFFNNIHLPNQSTNSIKSQGYVMFRVKVKTGVFPGQVIRNRATIYFDGFGSAQTNEAVVWIDESGAANLPQKDGLIVLPNPNNGIFETNIPTSPEGLKQFWITDLAGKQVNFEVFDNGSGNGSRIQMQTSEPGFYVFQAMTAEGILVAPFILVK